MKSLNIDQRHSANKTISFSNVEVIELPIICGENHPNNLRNEDTELGGRKKAKKKKTDTASITVGWEAQKRTLIQLETFEKQKTIIDKSRKPGRVKRLSRAFRKHLLGKREVEGTTTTNNSVGVDIDYKREQHQRRQRPKQQQQQQQENEKEPMRSKCDSPLVPKHILSPIPTKSMQTSVSDPVIRGSNTEGLTRQGDHTPKAPAHSISPHPTQNQKILVRPTVIQEDWNHSVPATEAPGFGEAQQRVDVTPKRKPRRGSMEYFKSVFRRGSMENAVTEDGPMWKSESFLTMTPTKKFRTNLSSSDHTPQRIPRRGSFEHAHRVLQRQSIEQSSFSIPLEECLDNQNITEVTPCLRPMTQLDGPSNEKFDPNKGSNDITPKEPKRHRRRSSMEHVKHFFRRKSSMVHDNTGKDNPLHRRCDQKQETVNLPSMSNETLPRPPDLSNSSRDMVRPTPTPVSGGSRVMRRSSLEHVTNYVRSTFRKGSMSNNCSCQQSWNDEDVESLDPNMEKLPVDTQVLKPQRRSSMEHVTNLVRSTFRRGSVDSVEEQENTENIENQSNGAMSQKRHGARRRSSMDHVKNVVTIIAKPPIIFAKIPIKLAMKRLKKRKAQQICDNLRCDDQDDNSAKSHQSFSSSAQQSYQSHSHFSSAAGSMVESLKPVDESKENLSNDFNSSRSSSALSDFIMDMLSEEIPAETHTIFIVPDDLHSSNGSMDFNSELKGEEDDDESSMPSLVLEESISSLKDQIKANLECAPRSLGKIDAVGEDEYRISA